MATVERNGKIVFTLSNCYFTAALLTEVTKLLPPNSYILFRPIRWRGPFWSSANPDFGWNQAVLIPYWPGDFMDMDSRFLHAQNRSKI